MQISQYNLPVKNAYSIQKTYDRLNRVKFRELSNEEKDWLDWASYYLEEHYDDRKRA